MKPRHLLPTSNDLSLTSVPSVYHLDLTLDTPAANLALDEALLNWAADQPPELEVLRLWESREPFVVIGRSSRLDQEVEQATCGRLGIPIFRRVSGGAAIVTGPGCLMYAVVLSHHNRPALQAIDRAHAFVLETVCQALRPLVSAVQLAGTSDLVMSGNAAPLQRSRKFSGNSMRSKRSHLLYHGTLLYAFDLPLIGKCLKQPPRQPAYRDQRDHGEFVENLPATGQQLKQALRAGWQAEYPLPDWPLEQTLELARDRYAQWDWTHQL